jgi:hypothetical protein
MIESLTPQLLMLGVFETTIVASLLTLLTSAAVLFAYRRGVLRAMARHAARTDADWPTPQQGDHALPGGDAPQVEFAVAASRRAALVVVAAGTAFALVFAAAALLAFPALRSAARFLLVFWVCIWPVVPALLISAPANFMTRLAWATSPFLLWVLALALLDAAAWLAPQTFAHSPVEYFYVITPPQALAWWLAANIPPTLMWGFFSNRRLRAVGPLVLGFCTAVAAGGMALLMALVMTAAGARWLRSIVTATALSPVVLVAVLLVLLLLAGAACGWACMRWARRAYRAKRANDQSLIFDALWLLFASWYVLVLVLAGWPWLLVAAFAFGAYRLTLRWARSRSVAPAGAAPSLVFLRVFSLGRRSDRLFDRLTRYWRHLASVDLICGPDIVHSTVQPQQLMDFLSGQLKSHFIVDPASLARRMGERDLAPDHDGRHRVNSFYCHVDTWTRVLPALVSGPVVVLMDLRSLAERHGGCITELQHLVAAVPLRRCVLVVDASTGRDVLQRTLDSAWKAMPENSPNRGSRREDLVVHHLEAGEDSIRSLLSRLCAAAQAPLTVAAGG